MIVCLNLAAGTEGGNSLLIDTLKAKVRFRPTGPCVLGKDWR